jgi:hypothetical protein
VARAADEVAPWARLVSAGTLRKIVSPFGNESEAKIFARVAFAL